MLPCGANGAELLAKFEYSYAKGRTSNSPKPPRIEVLPFRNGSQAKPSRGSKLWRVGFAKKGLPTVTVAAVGVSSLPSLAWTSDGAVVTSYRNPALNVRFGRQ